MKRFRINSLLYQIAITGLFLAFSYVFIWGEHGIVNHYFLSCDIELHTHELQALEKEIASFNVQLDNCGKNLFFTEKLAREVLGMADKGEVLYLY